MKNFQSYNAEKYTESKYKEVEEGIYQTKDPYNISKEDIYVTDRKSTRLNSSHR